MRSARAGVSTYRTYVSVLVVQACGNAEYKRRAAPISDDHKLNLEPHIVRDVSTCNECRDKAKVGITGSWICDFNLLEAAFYDLLKEVILLNDRHRICQGLVAVAEICREPDGGRFCDICRPGAVREVKGGIWLVLLGWI